MRWLQGHSDDDTGSYEYLVYQNVLTLLAAKYDLWPVTDYYDFDLDALLDPAKASADGSKLFRRFRADIEAEHSIKAASRLNCAFVFVKGRSHFEDSRQLEQAGQNEEHTYAPHREEHRGAHMNDDRRDDLDGADQRGRSQNASVFKRPSRSRRPAPT